MINWFDMPAEGLSNGGLFEVKELEVTENGTYEQSGEMYNKVTVNVEGGGGSSDFSTAEVSIINNAFAEIHMPFCLDGRQSMADSLITDSGTYTAILYKGMCYCSISDGTVTVEGDIIAEDGDYYITGDGTITIS